MMHRTPFLCLALSLSVLLTACATTRPVDVVSQKDFIEMARTLKKEMQQRHLLDGEGAYQQTLFSDSSAVAYGDVLYRQLSPSFLFDDTAGHVYLGETFPATRTPGSRVQRHENGFTIFYPTQSLRVTMLAVTDWNDDGTKAWVVSCRVVPLRGGRTREYYLLVPPPANARERLQATVIAVNDCFGLACTLYVKKAPMPQNKQAADPSMVVEDVAPGLENVTEAPSATNVTPSSLEERAL